MSKRYELLLSPLQVGNVLLKNRMVSTAGIPHMLQGTEEYPTDRLISHLANRAKNGAAAVYLNFAMRTDEGPGGPPTAPGEIAMNFPPHDTAVNIAKTSAHNYLCQTIDAIRYYESIAITQPMGSYTRTDLPGGPGKGGTPQHGGPGPMGMPSDPMELLRQEQEQCRGRSVDNITKKQIQEFIDSTVKNAKILKQFGFEMFSFHNAYHNGTMAEFWSTHTNHRTDEYGGSVQNRARLMIEVMDAMKQTFGKDFPIEMLISVDGLGVNRGDTFELAKLLEGKVDILHVRHGDKDPQHPIGFTSTRENPSPNLDAAAALKESIMSRGGSIKVGVSAGLQDPDFNERILREKKADIICMSRAWICDSEYGQKIYEGRGEDVNPCIRCNKCHVPNDSDKFRSFCSVNPKIGMEFKLDQVIAPVTRKKKVAVVGGGPAGMKCAVTCAQRGHEVTLYEKQSKLGGQLFHADYASFKWPLADFNHWLIRQTYQNGVTVRLNTEATREMLEREGYDDVVVAIGPRFKTPKLPIEEGTKTMLCVDVYGHEQELPHEIVVIGGSETGTETGMHLAEKGHHVTVMTRQGMLAADAPHAHYVVMMMDAYEKLPNFDYVRYLQKYVKVDPKGVTYIDRDGKEQFLPADLVVLSGGVESVPEACARFYGSGDHVHYIGDCYRAGDVHKAVTAGWATANQI